MSQKWPITKEEAAQVKKQSIEAQYEALEDPAQIWMSKKIKKSGIKMNPQRSWGWRILDFWCAAKGIAIEVISPDDNPENYVDLDVQELKRSGILIKRVRAFDDLEADYILGCIQESAVWNVRRRECGLKPLTHMAVK